MLDLELSTQFKRDLKKIQKQRKNKELLDDVVEQLQHRFYILPGFIGAGLMFAGLTGWCGMAKLLAKMPWNS